jgi:hypothetical protein
MASASSKPVFIGCKRRSKAVTDSPINGAFAWGYYKPRAKAFPPARKSLTI